MTNPTPIPEPYQPANGTEGADFMAAFCDRCTRDAAFRDGTGDSCPIVANTMIFKPTDDRYPREWIYGEGGYPTCTAFETAPVTIQGCARCRVRAAVNGGLCEQCVREAVNAERGHPEDCRCPDCTAAFMRDTGPWP